MTLPLSSSQPLFRARNVYLACILLLTVAGVAFGWSFGNDYMAARAALAESTRIVAGIDAEIEKIKPVQNDVAAAFEESKTILQDTVFSILPEAEQYIELTKILDSFFDNNYKTGSEIVVSNLRFGVPVHVENQLYAALPLSMTITASRDKFYTFLDFIENSGSFENGLRLLDLRSIRMSFVSEPGNDQISFSVDLNAYFRTSTSKNGTATNDSTASGSAADGSGTSAANPAG